VRAFPYIRDDSAASPNLERAQPSHDTFQRFRVFEMRAVAPVVHAPRGAAPAPRRVRSASRNSILSRAAAEPLGSLVPDTLREMETDEEFKLAKERLETEGQAALTREERARRRRALTGMDVPSFDAFVAERGVSPLRRKPTTILQVNIGLYCNQACSHCHVESSPLRKEEVMSAKTANRLIELIDNAQGSIKMLDITGGAPEMMEQFRPLVVAARARGLEVIDRCNLTVLFEPGQEDLPAFLASNGVKVVASLPCYSEENTDKQRGAGVFSRSIAALVELNKVGYGVKGTGLELDLMYNPGGAFLPPSEAALTEAYRSELGDTYGVEFSRLVTLTNMPIKRFADFLHREGKTEEYMRLLVENFNPAAAEGVMCRDLVSVSWDGRVFDCDFNQQLDMPMPRSFGSARGGGGGGEGLTVFDVDSLDELTGKRLAVDNHCFGCTAGAGSSCSGATA
jgi:radical SAM/Cys-rich protein